MKLMKSTPDKENDEGLKNYVIIQEEYSQTMSDMTTKNKLGAQESIQFLIRKAQKTHLLEENCL